nr:immunoglobulin heavy chain junction region [Mus musculus]
CARLVFSGYSSDYW